MEYFTFFEYLSVQSLPFNELPRPGLALANSLCRGAILNDRNSVTKGEILLGLNCAGADLTAMTA